MDFYEGCKDQENLPLRRPEWEEQVHGDAVAFYSRTNPPLKVRPRHMRLFGNLRANYYRGKAKIFSPRTKEVTER